jgi:hypothetical protein
LDLCSSALRRRARAAHGHLRAALPAAPTRRLPSWGGIWRAALRATRPWALGSKAPTVPPPHTPPSPRPFYIQTPPPSPTPSSLSGAALRASSGLCPFTRASRGAASPAGRWALGGEGGSLVGRLPLPRAAAAPWWNSSARIFESRGLLGGWGGDFVHLAQRRWRQLVKAEAAPSRADSVRAAPHALGA